MAGDATQTGRWPEADVWVAPLGSTPPATTTEAPGADWKLVGFLDGDKGVVRKLDEKSTPLRVWGGITVDSASEFNGETFDFTAVEDNDVVFGLIYEGSAAPTTTTGTTTRTAKIPNRQAQAWLIELRNGAKVKRYLIAKGKVSGIGDRTEGEKDLPTTDITIEVLGGSDRVLHTELLTSGS